jgi:response regulator of citrate/malate metabolism
MAPDSPQTLRIQILDDNPFYAKFLEKQIGLYIKEHFEKHAQMISVSSQTSISDFLDAIPAEGSLVVLDYYLENGIKGVELLQQIRERSAECRVIIMTTENNLEALADVLDTNIAGFVFKDEKTISLMHPIIEKELQSKLDMLS